MLRKKGGLLVVLTLLLLLPSVFAQAVTSQGYNFISDFYVNFNGIVDFILYFLIFGGAARLAFERKDARDKRAGKILQVAVSLVLSFSLVLWEAQTGFNLLSVGPYALGLLVLAILFNVFMFYRKATGGNNNNNTEGKGSSFIFFLIAAAAVFYFLLSPNSIPGSFSFALGGFSWADFLVWGIVIFFVIMGLRALWKEHGPESSGTFKGTGLGGSLLGLVALLAMIFGGVFAYQQAGWLGLIGVLAILFGTGGFGLNKWAESRRKPKPDTKKITPHLSGDAEDKADEEPPKEKEPSGWATATGNGIVDATSWTWKQIKSSFAWTKKQAKEGWGWTKNWWTKKGSVEVEIVHTPEDPALTDTTNSFDIYMHKPKVKCNPKFDSSVSSLDDYKYEWIDKVNPKGTDAFYELNLDNLAADHLGKHTLRLYVTEKKDKKKTGYAEWTFEVTDSGVAKSPKLFSKLKVKVSIAAPVGVTTFDLSDPRTVDLITLLVDVEGGEAPYKYDWDDKKIKAARSGANNFEYSLKDIDLKELEEEKDVEVTVTDKNGVKGRGYILFTVKRKAPELTLKTPPSLSTQTYQNKEIAVIAKIENVTKFVLRDLKLEIGEGTQKKRDIEKRGHVEKRKIRIEDRKEFKIRRDPTNPAVYQIGVVIPDKLKLDPGEYTVGFFAKEEKIGTVDIFYLDVQEPPSIKVEEPARKGKLEFWISEPTIFKVSTTGPIKEIEWWIEKGILTSPAGKEKLLDNGKEIHPDFKGFLEGEYTLFSVALDDKGIPLGRVIFYIRLKRESIEIKVAPKQVKLEGTGLHKKADQLWELKAKVDIPHGEVHWALAEGTWDRLIEALKGTTVHKLDFKGREIEENFSVFGEQDLPEGVYTLFAYKGDDKGKPLGEVEDRVLINFKDA